MEKKFNKVFEIRYYEINKYHEATPVAILNYLEETAIAHSKSVGNGFEKLKTEGNGWIVTNWYIEMERYPKHEEKILIETWSAGFNKFYALREYLIKDNSGDIIGRATSQWVFFDINKRRPIRIPQDICGAYNSIEGERSIDINFKDFKGINDVTWSKEFYVRRSDIDTNDHVNNVRYVDWMLETIPREFYNDYILKTIEVVYKKETCYGEIISSNCHPILSDENSGIFASSVSDKESDNKLAYGRTKWVRR